jgi:hypothetical protein
VNCPSFRTKFTFEDRCGDRQAAGETKRYKEQVGVVLLSKLKGFTEEERAAYLKAGLRRGAAAERDVLVKIARTAAAPPIIALGGQCAVSRAARAGR